MSQPFGIVVQEIPSKTPVRAELRANHVAAQDDAHQLAGVASPLRGAQHDVAGNIVGIVDELLGELAGVRIAEFKIQVLDSAEHHGSKQAQRRGRGDENVAALRGALLVADDLDALIDQLPPVEQFVIVDDPIAEIVNLLENAGGASGSLKSSLRAGSRRAAVEPSQVALQETW